MIDRALLVPPHRGPLVLPNSPFFGKLLRHARRGRMAVRDVNLQLERSYEHALADTLALRAVMEAALPKKVMDTLQSQSEDVFIGVLAAGGYEFTIAVIAALALGAAVVPMSTSVGIEEAEYYIKKSNQVLILSSSTVTEMATKVVETIKQKQGTIVKHIPILPNLPDKPICSALEMVISSNPPLSDTKAGIVIFTSGTTGKPKGAILRRSYIHYTAEAIGEGYDIDHNDVLLHVLPVHHTTGLGTSFFPWLMAGACIEFRSGTFDPEWVWNRWLHGGISVFSGVPTIYMRLKWYFEQTIVPLSDQDKARYVAAANTLRVLKCGSSALQQDVQTFWTQLRNGRPILTRYGATEFPGCIKVPSGVDPTTLPPNCVGMVVPGVEVKLTEGCSGELLVRSPYMFAGYLGDKEATIAAHDSQGYFKTGDIGQREGHLFFIIGRLSVDIIKSGGYKISAIDIERSISELPYTKEVAVVGVADPEYGQRVGALLVLKSDISTKVSLEKLRSDLQSKLAKYKMPTILRLVDKELPKGPTGKVSKKAITEKFFPENSWQNDEQIHFRGRRQSETPSARL